MCEMNQISAGVKLVMQLKSAWPDCNTRRQSIFFSLRNDFFFAEIQLLLLLLRLLLQRGWQAQRDAVFVLAKTKFFQSICNKNLSFVFVYVRTKLWRKQNRKSITKTLKALTHTLWWRLNYVWFGIRKARISVWFTRYCFFIFESKQRFAQSLIE